MAVIQRQKALNFYYQNPNICKQCKEIIRVGDNERPAQTRKKKFCNNSCAAVYNNIKFPKRKVWAKKSKIDKIWPERICPGCSILFEHQGKSEWKYCSKKCRSKGIAAARTYSDEQRTKHRKSRYRQLAIEEGQAKKLRNEGWEIFSPTVVCDRIGIKDGKVYFIEFKPDHNTNLRSGQQRLHDVVPDQYIVISHPKDFVWSENIGSVA